MCSCTVLQWQVLATSVPWMKAVVADLPVQKLILPLFSLAAVQVLQQDQY